jgi:dTMP kinase
MWIACEGIDGSGKTAVSIRVARRLRERGLRILHVREQGGYRSVLASRIRELSRDPELLALAPETELLLNAARESQVLAEDIRPALARGEIVITDRGLTSHGVLARGVRKLTPGDVEAVTSLASGGLAPDIVIWFDVDPVFARYRRRLRKIREKRLGTSGRKGLVGWALDRESREEFRELASREPGRWHVLDNTWRTIEQAEEEMLFLLAPLLGLSPVRRISAPRPLRVGMAGTLQGWVDAYFDFLREVAGRDPAMAALWAAGLEHPQAAAIRERALEEDPDVVTWSMSGLDNPEARSIRARAADRSPYHVARSVTGLRGDDAWEWRRRLAGIVPDQVLHSLRGMAEESAHAFRANLWDLATEEGLRSLSRVGDARSWGFRCRALNVGGSPGLAESLVGLSTRAAWKLREALKERFPLSVLRSLEGNDDPRSWDFRERFRDRAPRMALETVRGMGSDRARSFREALEEACPEEVASSWVRVSTEEAWAARRSLAERAPAGVLSSLSGFMKDRRAGDLLRESLRRSQGEPRIVRKAVGLILSGSAEGSPVVQEL